MNSLSDSDLATLERKPWLRLYLVDGDEDLIGARARYKEAQQEARVQLRKKGKEPHRRMVARGGIQTTAFEDPIAKEMK
jgi:hypothetical protein